MGVCGGIIFEMTLVLALIFVPTRCSFTLNKIITVTCSTRLSSPVVRPVDFGP